MIPLEAKQLSMFEDNVHLVPDNVQNNIVPFPSRPNPSTPIKQQTTSPLKDKDLIEAVKEQLLYSSKKHGYRNYMIFLFAIHTALRMNDVLTIRLQDIWDEQTLSINPSCHILESKTHKIADLDFSQELRKELKEYILTIPNRTPYTPLFPSQKTQSKVIPKNNKGIPTPPTKDDTGCLSRKSMWKVLHTVGITLNIDHLACHTCRKTAAYHIYQSYKGQLIENQFSALDIVQQILNHSSSNVTLRYIGVTPDITHSVYRNLNL